MLNGGNGTVQLTRSEIGKCILDGQHLIIYNKKVLRIPSSWLDVHPGGSLALLHFVGRDATPEINAYHNDQILPLVNKYLIGTLAEHGPWDPLLPPIAAGWTRKDDQWFTPTIEALTPPPSKLSLQVQEQHAAAYKMLHKRITDAGLYKTPYLTGYGPELIRYISLGLLSAYAFRHSWLLTSALALGLMWHQPVFFVHDLGHMGVTGNWNLDRLISILVADFIGGLSIGWWVDNHNVHHCTITFLCLVQSLPRLSDKHNDSDPFFAISPSLLSMMLFARFNLYRLSYSSMFYKLFERRHTRGGRWAVGLEFIGIIYHAATSPLHVQIVLSHFGMSTEDLGPVESFPHRQLRTGMDVSCPEQWDFIHGASLMVKEFAEKQGLTYVEFGFVSASHEVLAWSTGQTMAQVASVEAREAVDKKIAQREDAAFARRRVVNSLKET
ncbi:hypothetical protein BT96DRAFT_955527 [Gymnopus androsaceus JB14]|uniref:Delta 8-(E)-sphingolipid desaturase n=1 Tax=Gymnopus androsaceus JB14 TaxID=1447944 RepID=A0A6A4I490_9AGAR|nr:hypothetical protein BT96DRAFT_955527 [Gymnopus androsaceus JB14]